MSSKSKTAGYNVNASSMLSLLSEVSRHSDKHKRGSTSTGDDLNGKTGSGSNAIRRSTGKTASIFDRANRGIEARSARDRSHMLAREDLSEEARRVLESREKMEKKALLYEKLAKGEDLRGVSREQLREGLLVDFETKAIEEAYKGHAGADGSSGGENDSDSEEEDESRTVPKPPGQKGKGKQEDDDELVESTDDFGRTRWVRQSQLALEAASLPRGSVIDDGVLPYYSTDISLASHSSHLPNTVENNENNVYYGDQVDFHVYQPSEEEIAERRKRLNLDDPLNLHFDASKEIRNRGAGFIQLSGDEETRKRQMEELKNERRETEEIRKKREEAGGEGEGEDVKDEATRRREKELNDRKKLVEEKRNQILLKRKAAELAREGGSAAKKLK